MKKIKFAIFSIIAVILFCTVLYYDNSDAYSLIVTFLSITTGFSITALSIIATSKFSEELYTIESDKNNSLTLLHELVYGIKNSTVIFTTTIAIIILDGFVNKIDKSFCVMNYKISPTVFASALIWYFTFLSFFKFLQNFFTFSKFVIRNASNK